MEEREKTRVTVTIMGEEYILRSSSSPAEMKRIGRYVDRLMQTLTENNIQMSRYKVAVLAALNLADELIRLKEEKDHHSSGGDSNELV